MKKYSLLLFFIAAMQLSVKAQISINFVLNANPPARLSEWSSKAGTATLVISNMGPVQQTKRCRIRSEIKTIDGTSIAVTDALRTRIITVSPGNTVLSAADVLPLEAMQFTGSYNSKLQQTGKLPMGTYQLCVRLDSADAPIAITAQQCRNFTVTAVQLPILIAPAPDQILNAIVAQTAITFRWTNAFRGVQQDVPNYTIQVFEILSHQTPLQALRSNQPLLNTTIKGQTQYIWRPQLPFNDSVAHPFIWTLRTTDAQGALFTTEGNDDGRSEPQKFIIQNKLVAIKSTMKENKESQKQD